MAQLYKVRLPNGNVLTPGDWSAAVPLWSTVEIQAGPFPLVTAFSYGLGGQVPGSVGNRNALRIDTSLEGEGNRLPEQQELVIYNIGISVFKIGPALQTDTFPDADEPGVPLPDMLRLQRDLLVEFRIADIKDYTRAPLGYWPAGTGVAHLYAGGRTKISGAATTGEVVAWNGSTSRAGMRELATPLYVAGGEGMKVDIRPARGEVVGLNLAPNSRMRLRVYFDGYIRRPVA
jgi:hypothetical protein